MAGAPATERLVTAREAMARSGGPDEFPEFPGSQLELRCVCVLRADGTRHADGARVGDAQ
jgi:hypothetical protein